MLMSRWFFALRPRLRSWLACASAISALVVILTLWAQPSARRVLVIRSEADPPDFPTPCPHDRCQEIMLETFSCPLFARSAEAIIFSGHSAPPVYLNHSPDSLARVVACYRPELVVLDTCYGFSSPLLGAISRVRPTALVLGATYKLPPEGLAYGDAFFDSGPAAVRAEAIRTRSGAPLERWHADDGALRAALDDVARWDAKKLAAHLQRKLPNLVRVPLPGSNATVLVPVPGWRFAP
jgi:hypothetical protein